MELRQSRRWLLCVDGCSSGGDGVGVGENIRRLHSHEVYPPGRSLDS